MKSIQFIFYGTFTLCREVSPHPFNLTLKCIARFSVAFKCISESIYQMASYLFNRELVDSNDDTL